MWNYSFTLPSAMIMLILAVFYFRRSQIPIRINRSFLALLLVQMITLAADYLSSRVDERYMDFSPALGYGMNLLFFVFFLARIYCFFHFILDVLGNYCSLPRIIYRVSLLILVISECVVLSSPMTHAVFSMDANGYHRGNLYSILYACSFCYLITAVYLIMRNRRLLPNEVRCELLGAVLILAAGYVVRILIPYMLVMNTFFLLAILVFYLSFENPDLYLSDRGSAFNMRAFQLVLKEWSDSMPYYLVSFILQDYSEIRGIYGGVQMDEGIRMISEYLTFTYPDCLIFYLRNGSFVLVSSKRIDIHGVSEQIAHRFEKPWISGETEMMMRPSFVFYEMEQKKASSDHVINTLLLALENAGHMKYGDGQEASVSIQAIDQYLADKRALDEALKGDGLEVWLQPLVNSRTGRLVAAEALSRIRREDGQIVSPDVFIPIAEKDGSIVALGEQVLKKVCRFIHENDMQALGLQWINVNLSPYQCMNPELANRFRVVLQKYNIPAELIHLELTEQSISDYSLLERQLLALQKIGFQFALDDYGSGYSNLTRVKQIPLTNIKMDMAIVMDYFRERNSLLPAMVQVFKQMNFSITAEGIETREMAEALAEIGCDYLQGYYFSKPVSMEIFLNNYMK